QLVHKCHGNLPAVIVSDFRAAVVDRRTRNVVRMYGHATTAGFVIVRPFNIGSLQRIIVDHGNQLYASISEARSISRNENTADGSRTTLIQILLNILDKGHTIAVVRSRSGSEQSVPSLQVICRRQVNGTIYVFISRAVGYGRQLVLHPYFYHTVV